MRAGRAMSPVRMVRIGGDVAVDVGEPVVPDAGRPTDKVVPQDRALEPRAVGAEAPGGDVLQGGPPSSSTAT